MKPGGLRPGLPANGCLAAEGSGSSAGGFDDSFSAARDAMVRLQLAAHGRDIRNPDVLRVMREVPRHRFVPAGVRAEAYRDHPLPIGYGQTISQPFIVAFMTEALDPRPTDRVLEVGTGSGYQAAVLSRLVSAVFSLEIVEPLARCASTTLRELGFTNVTVRSGDGHQGWPDAAPFDAIMVTCAPAHVPTALRDQLQEGGRLILPVGDAAHQELLLLEKRGTGMVQRAVMAVRFVPMTGAP